MSNKLYVLCKIVLTINVIASFLLFGMPKFLTCEHHFMDLESKNLSAFHFEKNPIKEPCFVAVYQLRKYAVVLVDQQEAFMRI